MIRRVVSALAVVVALGAGAPAVAAAPGLRSPATVPANRSGYWMLAADGTVWAFGGAQQYGNGPAGAADIEPTPDGDGYWILSDRGAVSAHGAAAALGGSPALRSGERAASLSVTPSGQGYWIFTSAGRVFAYGDAAWLGDMSETVLNGPVLDSVATPSGKGYWLVASDGGIFSFGDAAFAGSMGATKLNQPVISMAPDPDGSGYWLVAADGGIFAFEAGFFGSMGSTKLNRPVSGMVPGAAGYLMVAEDGGIFAFGDVPFSGSLGGQPPGSPVVAVALLPAASPEPVIPDEGDPGPFVGIGPEPGPGAPAPVLIGHVGTYSGPLARPTGDGTWADATDALAAWVVRLNDARVMNYQRPLLLLLADDAGDPARHLDLVRSLDEAGVVALVGDQSAATGEDVWNYLDDHGLPAVGGDLWSDAWDTHPMLFSQGASLPTRTDGLNAEAKSRGAHKLAVLRCAESSVCQGPADYETNTGASKAGLVVAFSATISQVQPDYQAVCTSARNAGADAVFYPGGPLSSTWLRLQASCDAVGYHPWILVPATDIPPTAPMDKVLVGLPTLPWLSGSAIMGGMRSAIQESFPSEVNSPQSAQAWAAAALFARALDKARTLDRAGVLAGLQTINSESAGGLTPPLTFTAGHRVPARCYYLVASTATGSWAEPNGDQAICPA